MPRNWVTKLDAQRRLAGRLRRMIAEAAGSNTLLSEVEQAALPAFLQQVAETLRHDGGKGTRIETEALMDRAMADAMEIWAQFNPRDGSVDARYLSRDELRAIEQAHPALGELTRQAWESIRAQQAGEVEAETGTEGEGSEPPTSETSDTAEATENPETPPPPAGPEVTLTTTHPGRIRLERDGPAHVLISDAIEREEGPMEATLSFLGQRVTLRTFNGRLSTYPLTRAIPNGYWLRRESETTEGDQHVARFVIGADPPGSPSEGEALARARAGLIDYLRNERIHQPDWQSSFADPTWEGAVAAGILDDSARCGDPGDPGSGAEVIREESRLLFIGRGPLGLYTEVGVDKRTGAITRAYVEID